MVEFIDPGPLTDDDEGEEKREEALLDAASRSCASKFRPNATEKKLPANQGDNDIYPQFSEKCATNIT